LGDGAKGSGDDGFEDRAAFVMEEVDFVEDD
jgi:hypothetical protein